MYEALHLGGVKLGDNVVIRNVHYIAHYIVGNQVVLFNIDEMITVSTDEICAASKDVFDDTTPTNLPAEDPFEGDIGKRTLEIGRSEILEIEFTQDRVSDTGYSISVAFSNGDTVSISVP